MNGAGQQQHAGDERRQRAERQPRQVPPARDVEHAHAQPVRAMRGMDNVVSAAPVRAVVS